MEAFTHYRVHFATVRLSVNDDGTMRIEVDMPRYNRIVIDVEHAAIELVTDEVSMEDEAVSTPDPGGKESILAIQTRVRSRVPDGTPDGQDKNHHR